MEPNTMYIGVDPGGTTGLAAVVARYPVVPPTTIQVPASDVSLVLREWLYAWSNFRIYIGIERFVITERTVRLTRQPEAIEITGVVKDCANATKKHWGTEVSVAEQMKADAAKVASNNDLRAIGWYTKGMPHANDAVRQIVLLAVGTDPEWAASVLSSSMV